MKRFAPIFLLLLLLVSGIFALRHNKKNQDPAAVKSASSVPLFTDLSEIISSVGKNGEKTAPAETLSFEELGLNVLSSWKSPAALNDENFLKLEFRDMATNELMESPGAVSISVWNQRHSYSIVQPAITQELDENGTTRPGIYQASRIFFLAPGEWEVRIGIRKKDGSVLTQKLTVDHGPPTPNPMDDPSSPTSIMMKGMGMEHTVNHHRGKEEAEKKKINPAASKAPQANDTSHPH